jgi:hypothetical protein
VNKIFHCFHIYTVQAEQLKEFCDFIDIEYKQVLGSVKTRWLSLQPAITRVIDMFPGLKSYFLSQEKCPMMLNDPVSIVWFHFLESQLKVCCDTIKKIESDTISGSEVAEELDILANKMKSRRNENFCTSKHLSLLSDVEDFYSNDKFSEVADSFSNTLLLYLEKCSNTFLPLQVFHLTLLKNPLVWEEIQHTIKYITDVDQNITNISKNKMSDWNTNLITAVERWFAVFELVQSEGISLRYIHIILEFSLAIPGTSASIESIFFQMLYALWTDEKNCFLVETIGAVIVTKTHFQDLSCNDFCTLILKKPKLLQEICSSRKYRTSAQKEEPTTPTSDGN